MNRSKASLSARKGIGPNAENARGAEAQGLMAPEHTRRHWNAMPSRLPKERRTQMASPTKRPEPPPQRFSKEEIMWHLETLKRINASVKKKKPIPRHVN